MSKSEATATLETLAQDCILRSANSQSPRRVLTQHFDKAYKLGFDAGRLEGILENGDALPLMYDKGFADGQQKGLTQSAESLDIIATNEAA